MSNIIQFTISKEGGVYTAEGVNVPVVTEGETFEKLTENIQEAVDLYFENENPLDLGFGPQPAILTNFELAAAKYGCAS